MRIGLLTDAVLAAQLCGRSPDSDSFNIPTICSSVYRIFFIVLLPRPRAGLHCRRTLTVFGTSRKEEGSSSGYEEEPQPAVRLLRAGQPVYLCICTANGWPCWGRSVCENPRDRAASRETLGNIGRICSPLAVSSAFASSRPVKLNGCSEVAKGNGSVVLHIARRKRRRQAAASSQKSLLGPSEEQGLAANCRV
jgi:hypothetical protein